MWRQSRRVKSVSLILVSIVLWHFGGLRIYAQARSIQRQKQAEAPLTAFPESHFCKESGASVVSAASLFKGVEHSVLSEFWRVEPSP